MRRNGVRADERGARHSLQSLRAYRDEVVDAPQGVLLLLVGAAHLQPGLVDALDSFVDQVVGGARWEGDVQDALVERGNEDVGLRTVGSVMKCSAVFYGVLRCSKVFCGVLRCSAVFCGVLRCSKVL